MSPWTNVIRGTEARLADHMSRDVVVVGGGVIGAACAYALSSRGVSVTLVERGELAAGASGRNHGLLFVPTEPELVRMAAGTLPMIREVAEATPLRVRFDHEPLGFLVVAADREEMADARAEAEGAEANGVEVERVHAERLPEVEPSLAPGLAEGWLLRDGRRLDPAALTVALASAARSRGAEVLTHLTARALLVRGDSVAGVVTDDGVLESGTVVLAAGPWTSALLRPLGVHLPIAAVRGWLVHLGAGPVAPRVLVERGGWHTLSGGGSFRAEEPPAPELTAREVAEGRPGSDVGTLVQPNPDRSVLLGGSIQAALAPEPEEPTVPGEILRRAIALMPGLADHTVLGAWWGLRPASPDGLPVIGTVRPGLVVASGHGAKGVILSGGTAELVASLVTGDPPPFDTDPFAPDRFGQELSPGPDRGGADPRSRSGGPPRG
jgi:glycine/D-amino acid oxidase-like deaminating enzyme